MLNNASEFNKTASYWRLFYATESTSEDRMNEFPEYETKLLQFKKHPLLLNKNKCDSELVGILSSNNWDLNQSINCII